MRYCRAVSVVSVTFASAFLLWLARRTGCLLGMLAEEAPRFFWITFAAAAHELIPSLRFSTAAKFSSLPPILANELGDFRSLARVKQKLGVRNPYEFFCANSESFIFRIVIYTQSVCPRSILQ